MTTMIARTVVNAVVPIVLLVAAVFLLQGHNVPGGGFIAGVLTAVGIALLYIVHDMAYVEDLLRGSTAEPLNAFDQESIDTYWAVLATGLFLAAGTGVTAILFDLPFLTHTFWILHLPIYTDLHVASAFFFDLGVYLVVAAGLLAILAVVGEE